MCHWHVAQPQPPTPAVMEQLLGYVRFKLMHAEFSKEHVLSSPHESKRFINVLVVALLEPVVSPRKADLPRGVQRNLPSSFLEGWTKHYEEPYSHKTPSEILDSIPESAKHLLVGSARSRWLHLPACGYPVHNDLQRGGAKTQSGFLVTSGNVRIWLFAHRKRL